jgi:membrane-bound ClpP family serine protease
MSSEPSKNVRAYKTAATLFLISGVVFIVEAAVTRKIGVFLPVGIALIIIGTVFLQHSKRLTNGADKKED